MEEIIRSSETVSSSNVSSNIGRTIFFAIVIVLLLTVVIYFIMRPSQRSINAYIPNQHITVIDSLSYTDNTKNAKSWEWDFGNGLSSNKRSGKFKFDKAGIYMVRLIVDQDLSKEFEVTVSQEPVIDTAIAINGPRRAVVGEPLNFHASGNGRRWEWKFGQTGGMDFIGPDATYTYSRAGSYTVKLSNGINALPATLKIRVLPPLDSLNAARLDTLKKDPIAEAEKAAKKKENDIKIKLQAIADGGDFNFYYYDIINNYLCNNDENTFVVANEKKTDIYKYCSHLHFEKQIVIDDVAIQQSPNNCISQLTVKEHTKTD